MVNLDQNDPFGLAGILPRVPAGGQPGAAGAPGGFPGPPFQPYGPWMWGYGPGPGDPLDQQNAMMAGLAAAGNMASAAQFAPGGLYSQMNDAFNQYNQRGLQAYQGDQQAKLKQQELQNQLELGKGGQSTLSGIFGGLFPGGVGSALSKLNLGGLGGGGGFAGGGSAPQMGFQATNGPQGGTVGGGGGGGSTMGASLGTGTGSGAGSAPSMSSSAGTPVAALGPQQQAVQAGLPQGQGRMYQVVQNLLKGLNGPAGGGGTSLGVGSTTGSYA